jgi:hypothetical protein
MICHKFGLAFCPHLAIHGRSADVSGEPDRQPDGRRGFLSCISSRWRGGRVVEGARLESVYTGNRIAGSNPAPSATTKPL